MGRMVENDKAVVLCVGDLILDYPEVERRFDATRRIFQAGDVVVGQVEVPHTLRPAYSTAHSHCAPPADPAHLKAMADAGFNVATCGGNHAFDQGEHGVTDMLDELHRLGLATAGAGRNLAEAREPALLEKKGLRFAVLQYNCNGPKESWAAPLKAGAAFVKVSTVYEFEGPEPGSPPTLTYTVVDPATFHAMGEDIKKAKETADVVIVGFHIGRMSSAELLQTQFQITHYAIDCGAEMVVCHHAHTLNGVEMYRGKPIFHNLGNFVTLTKAFEPDAANAEHLRFDPFHWQGVKLPRAPYGELAPIPGYAFNETSRFVLIAKGIFDAGGLEEARMIPCYIDETGQPVPRHRDDGGQQVLDHVLGLNRLEQLNTKFSWTEDGTEIVLEQEVEKLVAVCG